MVTGPPSMQAGNAHLLIVDDDQETRDLLSIYLSDQGFGVSAVPDGQAMDEWLVDHSADLVVLDLMLPGEDGLSLARRLRGDYGVPIIMISARGEDVDRIVGLEVGADDYLPKPFNPRELLARIRAVLRRNQAALDAVSSRTACEHYEFGPFSLDLGQRTLHRGEEEVELSRAEFELLQVFVMNPNIVLSRDMIMDRLSGRDRDPFDRSIDVRVTRLRHRVEEDHTTPRFIRTVWGVGYQFTPKGDSA